EVLARERVSPVTVRPFAEHGVAILRWRAPERELVLALARHRPDEPVEQPRVRELVLGDRGERQVLLDVRRPPRPLRMAVADDELIVGEREEEREPRVGVLSHPDRPAPSAWRAAWGRARRGRGPRAPGALFSSAPPRPRTPPAAGTSDR